MSIKIETYKICDECNRPVEGEPTEEFRFWWDDGGYDPGSGRSYSDDVKIVDICHSCILPLARKLLNVVSHKEQRKLAEAYPFCRIV
jgi:hypothetical protein